ncbi:MAG: XRE family transcriptional regulator, partial [Pedobacter sp.]
MFKDVLYVVMMGIHMGELLERAVKQRGMSLTQIAIALNISRRTLYNWFKQETIDEVIMQRISKVMLPDRYLIKGLPGIISENTTI